MSGRGKDKQSRALVAHPGYEVGYGKPPEETRFKPGRSGNPRGRPKGAKNKRPALHEERMKGIILDEAYRTITVRDGERTVTVSMAQAIIRSLAVNAAKGQHRAQRLFAELLSGTESANRVLHIEWLETAMTYKIEWEQELDRRARFGITDLPDPLPHPDDVKIDFVEGTVVIAGPATKEEKEVLEWYLGRQELFEEKLRPALEARAATDDPNEIRALDDEIAMARRTLEIVGQIVDEARPDVTMLSTIRKVKALQSK